MLFIVCGGLGEGGKRLQGSGGQGLRIFSYVTWEGMWLFYFAL
jgi:hypothetical protein